MSSAIGLSSPTRNQASIPLTQSFQGVQDFSKFDAAELSGYVEAQGSSSFRASVKLSIVKNGAGTYEVAASDIAGDDVSGAPLVSFQMTGSLLEAKIDDGVASFSSAVIKFALISPPNSAGSLSVDASSVVSGTIDSARLPLATGSSAGAIEKKFKYKLVINTATGDLRNPVSSNTNIKTISGFSNWYASNLESGKTYEVSITGVGQCSTAGTFLLGLSAYNGTTTDDPLIGVWYHKAQNATASDRAIISGSFIFTATSSELSILVGANEKIYFPIAGTVAQFKIKELPSHEETTDFNT